MDDKNENIIVYPAFIMLFLSFVCLISSYQSWLILLAGACLGLGYGNLSSAMQSIAINVPPIKYGIATSTFYVGLDAGVGFGPSFLGLFTHMFSYSENLRLYGRFSNHYYACLLLNSWTSCN